MADLVGKLTLTSCHAGLRLRLYKDPLQEGGAQIRGLRRLCANHMSMSF